MYIIPLKCKKVSGCYKLNLLFNEKKVYIMDNHLAASWCWMRKLNPNEQYKLLHIDRHYDLLDSQIVCWMRELKKQNFDFTKNSIYELLEKKYYSSIINDECQIFRWDNYLTILNKMYPNLIIPIYFATHKDGNKIKWLNGVCEPEIYELHENLAFWLNNSNKQKWIVNIDIDYFFTERDGRYFQFLTDYYAISIARELKKAWKNIKVLTIALSPEFCGGWNNSLKVAKVITNHLRINFDID